MAHYCWTTGADETLKANIKFGFGVGCTNLLLNSVDDTDKPYRVIGSLPGTYGAIATHPFIHWPILLDIWNRKDGTPTDIYLAAMQKNLHAIFGGNQMSFSPTVGIGPWHASDLLHDDADYTGQESPSGYTQYAWDGFPLGFQQNFFTIFNEGGSFFSAAHNASSNNSIDISNHADHRVYEPDLFAIPGWDHYWNIRWVINAAEFTMQQSIQVQIEYALYLHCWDGNDTVYGPTRQMRFKWRAA
jgi:hypothetical protein